jgi:hypothetical protein
MDSLVDKAFVPHLRYLEFRGVFQKPNHCDSLDHLTKCRPTLENVYEYDGRTVLIRDMERTPLSHGLNQSAVTGAQSRSSKGKNKVEGDDEEDWEGENDADDDFYDDDHLIPDNPKTNSRMIAKIGQQYAMRDALSRDLYDFETDSDYGDNYLEFDDPEINAKNMKEMLKLMRWIGVHK